MQVSILIAIFIVAYIVAGPQTSLILSGLYVILDNRKKPSENALGDATVDVKREIREQTALLTELHPEVYQKIYKRLKNKDINTLKYIEAQVRTNSLRKVVEALKDGSLLKKWHASIVRDSGESFTKKYDPQITEMYQKAKTDPVRSHRLLTFLQIKSENNATMAEYLQHWIEYWRLLSYKNGDAFYNNSLHLKLEEVMKDITSGKVNPPRLLSIIRDIQSNAKANTFQLSEHELLFPETKAEQEARIAGEYETGVRSGKYDCRGISDRKTCNAIGVQYKDGKMQKMPNQYNHGPCIWTRDHNRQVTEPYCTESLVMSRFDEDRKKVLAHDKRLRTMDDTQFDRDDTHRFGLRYTQYLPGEADADFSNIKGRDLTETEKRTFF